MSLGGRALREGEDRPRLGHAAPADVLEHDPRLARREPDLLGLRAHDLLLCLDGRHYRAFWTFACRSPA